MPLFGSRPRNHNIAESQKGRGIARPPFRFGSWLRLHGFDILTMAILGALALGIYFADPAPTRSFPLFNVNGEVIYPQFAYPLRRQIVPIWLSALISFLAPLVFVGLFQIRRRSMDDFFTTMLGVLKSLITAALFQVIIKWLIGGLRPHFYDVCRPNIQSDSKPSGTGFANLMYDRSVCTGDEKEINDSLESMPSGHSTAAWAGLLFLALYFNAQLKVISAHNPAYWKMVLFFAPILGAFLISASLTIDEFHNWYDVLVGGLIGSACALIAFRQTFASIFDFRFNHILLPRATSLFHRSAFLPSGRNPWYNYQPVPELFSHDLPFTREGGWGHGSPEQLVGAPGDATVLTSGAASNFGNSNYSQGVSNFGPGSGANTMNSKLQQGAPAVGQSGGAYQGGNINPGLAYSGGGLANDHYNQPMADRFAGPNPNHVN